jgi:hypothetical protein
MEIFLGQIRMPDKAAGRCCQAGGDQPPAAIRVAPDRATKDDPGLAPECGHVHRHEQGEKRRQPAEADTLRSCNKREKPLKKNSKALIWPPDPCRPRGKLEGTGGSPPFRASAPSVALGLETVHDFLLFLKPVAKLRQTGGFFRCRLGRSLDRGDLVGDFPDGFLSLKQPFLLAFAECRAGGAAFAPRIAAPAGQDLGIGRGREGDGHRRGEHNGEGNHD